MTNFNFKNANFGAIFSEKIIAFKVQILSCFKDKFFV